MCTVCDSAFSTACTVNFDLFTFIIALKRQNNESRPRHVLFLDVGVKYNWEVHELVQDYTHLQYCSFLDISSYKFNYLL